ncbi:hypothetical protein D3C85_1188220 [compost metagenome]
MPSGGFARAQFVVLLAPGQACGEGQRFEQQVSREIPHPVQGHVGLVGLAFAGEDFFRAVGAPTGVDRVAVGGVQGVVAMVHGKVKFAQSLVFVTQATGQRIVFQRVAGDGQASIREALQRGAAVVIAQGRGRIEEAFGIGVLVGVGGKAVGRQTFANADFTVQGEVVLIRHIARAPAPGAVAVVLFAGCVDIGGAGIKDPVIGVGVAGRVLAAGIEAQGQEAVVGQGDAFPAAEFALDAVALVVAAEAVSDVASVVLFLEHDVDHTGDGV